MYDRNQKVIPVYIEDEMKDSYIDYAMSVIVGRALPDVRDGLKPVHRRILYTMKELGLEHNKPYKKSARIVGECFIKDTLILTEKGLVPIQDIKRGTLVYTQSGLKGVNELYEMPPKELLRIELDNGTYNTVTPSQKLKVLNNNFQFEWKGANKLKSGDYIVLKSYYPNIRQKVKLRKIHPLNPGCLNEDIAYLLGIFMSDGWIEKNKHRKDTYRISISSNRPEIIEKVADILMKEFDYLPNIEKRAYIFQNVKGERLTNCRYTIRINKRYVNKFLIENFNIVGLKAPSKRVPRQIFVSPKSVIHAFISGLIDGDGSLHSNRNVIHYGSVSEKLIDQLQILLQQLGMFGAKYVDDNLNRSRFVCNRRVQGRFRFHYLEFKGINAKLLASKIILYDLHKNAKRIQMLERRLKKSWFEVIPYAGENIFNELSKKHLGGGWYVSASGEKFRAGVQYATGCKIGYSKDLKEKPLRKSQIIEWGIKEKLEKIQSPLYDFIKSVIQDNIYFMKVSSITKLSAQITYDIQVEGDHEFIANGMVAHNCLGKYHPHGDIAVYDALVRMVQDFSLRYPLIEGQGNFGSVDGDSPAALRYTEARLASIADEMLSDIDKDTVDFTPNFDDTLREPSVLPSILPNLLVNGSSGIAVGMATNVPSHNLGEIVDGICMLIDNPKVSIDDLMKIVQGPDFPTGGLIRGRDGIRNAYITGKGLLKVNARANVETTKSGKEHIVITEIPYQVNKANLISSIADLVQSKRIEGVADLRDESDREGMRIVVELKRDQIARVTLNQLYKHTQLQGTFGVIMLALVKNRPQVLTLKEILSHYIDHRRDVIKRRTKFELDKAQNRAHILEGLKKALKELDKVIELIKKSKTAAHAKEALIEKLALSPQQAQAILEMQLQRLTALEREKIDEEYLDLIKRIELYQSILASEAKVLGIVKEEVLELKKKFADPRRTEIIEEVEELEIEDLIAEEDMIITISCSGYIKRLPVSSYRRQRRGGVGVTGMEMKEEDFVEHLFIASTHDHIGFFTDKGKVYWPKVHEIPQAGRLAKGTAVINFLQIESGESISSLVPVKDFKEEGKFLVMATRQGFIKKTRLDSFSNPRKGGVIAVGLEEGDELIDTKLTDGNQEILLATKGGKAIRFKEVQVRDMGRSARGVRGINLAKKDCVVGMEVVDPNTTLLTVTSKGYGKRTKFSSYRTQSRSGKGIINVKVTKKNGEVVNIKTVIDNDELIIVTQEGMVVRLPVNEIRTTGRATQGVKLISLKKEDRVTSIAKVVTKG